MRRLPVLFYLLSSITVLACSGNGATITDSANDISAAPPVEPSTPSAAPVDPTTKIECKTSEALSDGAVHTITFTLRGDALDSEITIEPPSPILAPLAKATLEKKNGKLLLVTTERAELTLFENSDLTRGYVKAADDFSNVYCTKR